MVDLFLEQPFHDVGMWKVTYSWVHSQENKVSYEVEFLDLKEGLLLNL